MYGHHYSKGTISNMTANIQREVEAFHKRQLEKHYVVIYADATYLNARRDCVDKEALHVLLGITPDGKKEILSYALYPTEGAGHYQEMLADIYSEENAHFSSKTHHGFGQCRCAVDELFEARYPAPTTESIEAVPAA